MDKKKKIIISLIIIGVVILSISFTLTYFRSNFSTSKKIATDIFRATYTSTLDQPDFWVPGSTATGNFKVKNETNLSVAVRAKIEEHWYDQNDNEIPNQVNSQDVAAKTIGTGWGLYDGYYYYNKTLDTQNEETSNLIPSIEFADLFSGTDCISNNDGTKTCSYGGGYATGKYSLVVTFEVIQADAYETEWQTNRDVVARNSNSLITIDLGNNNTVTTEVNNYTTVGSIDLSDNTPTGYHVDHFEDEDGNTISDDTVITEELTITPIFVPNTYTLSFDLDGDGEIDTTREVTYDEEYGTLPTPTAPTGYHFDGWYLEEEVEEPTGTANKSGRIVVNFLQDIDTNPTFEDLATRRTKITSDMIVKITSNQTLIAHFEPNTYTITLDDGTNTTTIEVNYNSKFSNLTTPSKTGYTFVNWLDENDNVITTDTRLTTASNITLHAQWSNDTYTVTFDAGTGSVNPASKSVTYNQTYGNLPEASKTGYDFDGWFIGSDEITSNSRVTTAGNHTLTAHYSPQSTTVTLHNDGNTSTIDAVYDATYADAGLTAPTKTGYTFVNWNTNSNGTGIAIEPGTTVSDLTITELYAYYIPNTDTAYTVRHYQQKIGGDEEGHNTTNYDLVETDANTTGTTGESITPDTKNYTGFESPSTETTTIAADGSTVVEYYYTRNSYNLTVNLGTGVTSIDANSSYEYGATVSITPTYNTGYEFDSVTGDKDTLTFTMPASNTTITINGRASTYAVTANAGTGTIDSTSGWTNASDNKTATKSVTYDSEYGTLPTIISPSGYHFYNWYKENNYQNIVTSATTVSTASNHSIYAQIIANTATLTYNSNGGNTVTTTNTITNGSTYGAAISNVTPTWIGHTFSGWFTEATNGTQVLATDVVNIATNASTQELFAHWTVNSYTANFSDGAHYTNPGAQTVTYGGSTQFNLTIASGYKLSSITCDNNGYALSYTANATGTVPVTITNSTGLANTNCTINVEFNVLNSNIKGAYTYDETTCQTGNEPGCVVATCVTNETTCPAGTIIDYQVDNDPTYNTHPESGQFPTTGIMRFHVLRDDGMIMTLQSQKNVVIGVAWTTGDSATNGPTTIVPTLELVTKDWSNVNTLYTTYMGSVSGCPWGDTGTTTCNQATYSDYTTGTSNKARLISATEAQTYGNCGRAGSENTNLGTCAKWMVNYLYRDDLFQLTVSEKK